MTSDNTFNSFKNNPKNLVGIYKMHLKTDGENSVLTEDYFSLQFILKNMTQ